jgi:hypothetical protein
MALNSVLLGVPRETLLQWLADAQQAYVLVMSGTTETKVKIGEREVTYSASNSTQLQVWIRMLQQELGMDVGRRAIGVVFR